MYRMTELCDWLYVLYDRFCDKKDAILQSLYYDCITLWYDIMNNLYRCIDQYVYVCFKCLAITLFGKEM